MTKYRKKPIVIEAEQWWPDHLITPKPHEPDILGVIWCYDGFGQVAHGRINTLEGDHTVTIGDWIITGIKGEPYSVKNEIFKETYELVGESLTEIPPTLADNLELKQ